MTKWSEKEIQFLVKNYPVKGREFCSTKLNRSLGSIRSKVARLNLKYDYQGKHFDKWQSKAAKSKIGKKRPDQAKVMSQLHKKGKLKQTFATRSAARKKGIANNGHPKGMLGKKHTEKTKQKFSQQRTGKKLNLSESERQRRSDFATNQIQSRLSRGGSIYSRSTQGWYTIAKQDYYFRSKWEVVYARYLQFLLEKSEIKNWEYEPDTFWFESIKRGVRSYLPDFKITNLDGSVEYHEVKGYMDSKSKTKIKRMKKYYPDVKLLVIGKTEYKPIAKYERLYPEAIAK